MDVMEEPEKAKLPTESALEVRQTLVMPILSDRKKIIRAVDITTKGNNRSALTVVSSIRHGSIPARK